MKNTFTFLLVLVSTTITLAAQNSWDLPQSDFRKKSEAPHGPSQQGDLPSAYFRASAKALTGLKAAQVKKVQLDSTYTSKNNETTKKEFFKYTPTYQLDEYQEWYIEKIQTPDPEPTYSKTGYKCMYAYDGAGKLTSETEYNFNVDLNKWEENHKYSFLYNGDGTVDQILELAWSVTDWAYSSRIKYTYTSGILTDETESYYNSGTSQWDRFYKTDYAYANGKVLTETQSFSQTGETWKLEYKYEYLYATNKTTILELKPMFDAQNAFVRYDSLTRVEHLFDNNGNFTQANRYNYVTEPNATTGTWKNISNDSYVYDANNNLTDYYYWGIDQTSLLMEAYYHGVYTYDNTIGKSEMVYPSILVGEGDEDDVDVYRHKMTYIARYEKANGQWIADDNVVVYYSNLAGLGFNSLTMQVVNVSMSSIDQTVTYSFDGNNGEAKLKMYNSNGTLALAQQLPADGTVSVSHLANGIYIYVITNGSFISKGKLMVR